MALTQSQIQRLMVLRGFGYREADIAIDLKVSRKTISNHLMRLKAQSKDLLESGLDLNNTYFKLFGFPSLRGIV